MIYYMTRVYFFNHCTSNSKHGACLPNDIYTLSDSVEVTVRVVRPAFSPLPPADVRHIVTIFRNELFVFDEFIADGLFDVSRP